MAYSGAGPEWSGTADLKKPGSLRKGEGGGAGPCVCVPAEGVSPETSRDPGGDAEPAKGSPEERSATEVAHLGGSSARRGRG